MPLIILRSCKQSLVGSGNIFYFLLYVKTKYLSYKFAIGMFVHLRYVLSEEQSKGGDVKSI
jgi:hypothetical protein